MASVLELSPTPIKAEDHEGSATATAIRLFQLTLNDVTVELSSLGASITKLLLPNYSQTSGSRDRDDIVLSYASPKDQYEDKNTPFFGAIVGRVANRIKDGQFQLAQISQSSKTKSLETYQLDKNNSPNHLHGGYDGFCTKIWDSSIVNDTVQFTLISPDGDQGYPGGVNVTATYSLVHLVGKENGNDGAKLCLTMHASLLPGETKATPIALAQHSYFNLASHSCQNRILDHTLHLPNCSKFTPLDNTSIPTRVVQQVDISWTKAMDFCKEKLLAEALIEYGEERAGLEHSTAMNNVQRILKDKTTLLDSASGYVARVPKKGGAPWANLDGDSPYGFDHNYAIDRDSKSSSEQQQDSLHLAAILSHPLTRRSLRVLTTAPGMQLYTSNYLDGSTPPQALCKDGTSYQQWQGVCLETQTYPDSIFPDEDDVNDDDEFAKGKCFILRPGGREYFHDVEYEFHKLDSTIPMQNRKKLKVSMMVW